MDLTSIYRLTDLADPSLLATMKRVDLRCPLCLAPLSGGPQELVCSKCSQQYPVSDGIPVLQRQSPYFGEFTREEMSRFLREAAEDLEQALQNWIPQVADTPRLGEYILGSGRAGWKFLLPVSPEAVALDLGCGWGAISHSLAHNCDLVVAADSCLERMKFLQIRATNDNLMNIQYVCCGSEPHLPFPDAAFHVVILNGVLEWVPIGRAGNPERVQHEFLCEVRRVLHPQGALWLAIENRWAWNTWFRRPDGHTGLRFVVWLPRPLANIYARWRTRTPYRNYLYGPRALRNLLKRAGFHECDIYVPLPGYHHPDTVVPFRAKQRIMTRATRPTTGLLPRFKQYARAVLTAHFPDSFAFLASSQQVATFVERLQKWLAAHLPEEIGSQPILDQYRINGEMGMVTILVSDTAAGNGYVIKLPLHHRAEAGLRREVTFAATLLHSTPMLRPIAHLFPQVIWSGVWERQYLAVMRRFWGVTPGSSLNSERLRAVGLHAAARFAIELHRRTSGAANEWGSFTQAILESHARLIRPLLHSKRYEHALAQWIHRLAHLLECWPRITVLGHGDYKLANCLFDPKSGNLSAVLDWGGGLQPEISGYDLAFLFTDYLWQYKRLPLPDVLRIWLTANFSRMFPEFALPFCEIGLPLDAGIEQALGAYQWLKRLAPLGERVEAQRFNRRMIADMAGVILEATY